MGRRRQRWREFPYGVRYSVYGLVAVALIALLYLLEGVRGSLALEEAKRQAAAAGLEMDPVALLEPEPKPPPEENFASCEPALQAVGEFEDLDPLFAGATPHREQFGAAGYLAGRAHAEEINLAWHFAPLKEFDRKEANHAALRLLREWEDELATITEASHRPVCVYSIDWEKQNTTEFIAPSYRIRGALDALYARAIASLQTADAAQAVRDTTAALRILELHHRQPRFNDIPLAGNLLQRNAQLTWEGLLHRRFSPSQLEHLQYAFAQFQPEKHWSAALETETAIMSSGGAAQQFVENPVKRFRTFRGLGSTKINSRPIGYVPDLDFLPDFSWIDSAVDLVNGTTAALMPNGWYRQSLADTLDRNVELIRQEKPLRELHDDPPKLLVRSSPYCFVWGEIHQGTYQFVLHALLDAAATVRQACAAIAFERHYLAHEEYPSDFAGLVPEYLEAVPIDPWSGQPMRLTFRPNGRPAIYSVGENRVDDGGVPPRDIRGNRGHGGDIVWHYSLPPEFEPKR